MDPNSEIEQFQLPHFKEILYDGDIAVNRARYYMDIESLLKHTGSALENTENLSKEHKDFIRKDLNTLKTHFDYQRNNSLIDPEIYHTQVQILTENLAKIRGYNLTDKNPIKRNYKKLIKPAGLAAAAVIGLSFVPGCIGPGPTPTTPPKTTQEPTQTPTYTPPTTTSEPTLPPTTTPASVDYERNICEERQLPENLIQFVKGLDYDNNANDNEIYVADTAKDFIEKGITPEITEELFNLSYKKGGKEDLEYLVQNIDTSVFKKMIEDELIENHEKRLIDKSFTYSGLQKQLKILDDKASENFLKTYKTVIYKSESGRTEPERFLYEKIDEHLPEFVIGEDGFLYYGKEKIFKVDDKNLYVKWLTEPYNPIGKERWKIWEKRDCHWEAGFDKEFSLCWSKFIDEETDIPWNTNTKYFSVKPIEDKFKDTSNEVRVKLKFDKFGYNGLGYDQIFDIYIYRLRTNEPRTRLFIEIPKSKEQLYNHYIGLYDKGTHINDDDSEDPNIIFSYEILYKENKDILDRSFAELYYATEFFWDYINLAKLIGPFEEE